MTNPNYPAIKQLERNVIGVRYLLEVYKIANATNERVGAKTRALALHIATTFLRSMIVELCIIFHKGDNKPITKNCSLKKLLKTICCSSVDKYRRPTKLLSESIEIMKSNGFYDLRNQRIAHLDLKEIVPSQNKTEIYEELVSNAETIIFEIIKEENLQPEREDFTPKPETDAALIQLKKLLV